LFLGSYAMTKKKGPQMAHPYPAQEALAQEFDALIEDAAEQVDEAELVNRQRKANEIVETARARASRKERA
jgi:hypothetical protein